MSQGEGGAVFANGEYPDSWDEYIGQRRAKHALLTYAHECTITGENLPHMLICGPPGNGKTALVQLMLRQANKRVHLVSGQINLSKARVMFSMVSDGDVIFYDEFHKVMDGSKKGAEWLLHYLQDGVLLTPFGEEPVPKVTIIGATTDKGVLPEPIRDRFLIIDLVDYTDEEGTQVALALSGKIMPAAGLPIVNAEVAAQVARATGGKPRLMRNLLRSLRATAITGQIKDAPDGAYDLSVALDLHDLSPDGLDKDARAYMLVMWQSGRGEGLGEAYLKRRLGTVGKGLENIESLLQARGYIQHGKTGRTLSQQGLRRAYEMFGALDSQG